MWLVRLSTRALIAIGRSKADERYEKGMQWDFRLPPDPRIGKRSVPVSTKVF